jgi:hypothetical protein
MQRDLTDDELMRVVINACDSLNTTRAHELGGETTTIANEAGLLEIARAVEARVRAALASAPAAEPVQLLNFAVWDDGELRLLSGRKGPTFDCELYAMPDGGRAPPLYADAPSMAAAHAAPDFDPQAQMTAYGSIAERAQAGLDAGWWKPEGAAPAAKSLRRSATVLLDMVAVVEKAAEAQPELRAELPGYITTMRAEAEHLTAAARLLDGRFLPPEQGDANG